MEPSMVREKSWVERVSEFGPMIISSDLSQLSFRKLSCIHILMSVRQVLSWECVVGEIDFVER